MKESFIVLAFVCFNFELAALQRRIYNGQNARANEFPYIALIRTRGMYCGGALISDRFVLTAAHCVMNLEQDERFTVVLGSHNYYVSDDDQKVVKLRASMKFWKHENFTMPSAVNDIAIIELSKNVTFSDNIKPISISRDKLIDDKRVVAVIAGWGETEKTEPDVLQTAKMKLIPINDCIKYQKHFIETLSETNICAFGVQEKPGLNRTIGPCDGDSGSPLVVAQTNELIGITSFVKDAEDGKPLRLNDCSSGIAPAVYVRVHPYLDWISEKTGIQID